MATQQPGTTGRHERPTRRGFWDFWTTLPGILTGLAALIGAIIGVINLIDGNPGPEAAGQGPATTGTTIGTTSTVPDASTSVSAEPSKTAAAVAGKLIFDRDVDIALDYGIDFESHRVVPKEESDVYYTASFFSAAMEANTERNVTLAGLDRGKSGYQSCKDATGYVPSVELERVRPGDAFCTFSSDIHKVGQFRFVEVKSRGSNPVLTWKVKIWSDT